MDGPVVETFAIFARSVERIDDPDPARGATRGIVGGFLGQDEVVRPCGLQAVEDQRVGLCIAAAAEIGIGAIARGAEVAEQGGRFQRDRTGDLGVVHRSGLHTPMIYSTIRSAATSGLSRIVSIRISGLSGAS